MAIKLYNSLGCQIQEFQPLRDKQVGLYTCGPTVYWYAHLGNLRTYVFEDILKRVLEFNGLKVKHVMNITDVGHLTSDADQGEDKLEKGAARENKTVWEVAQFYTEAFINDLKALNIIMPDVLVKATDTIKEQIELIQELEKKGYTYKIEDGIYFDTSKLPTYGALWPNKMELKAGARVEMSEGKKNATDFALWKFSPKDSKRQMEWDSPWGIGFPGWHTECVAMAAMHLGLPFDIHCGGIDHVLIHHTNEIAQAEASSGKIPANFWLHGEFMLIKTEQSSEADKISKSKGNIILVSDISKKVLNPLAFRYLCLTTHYRSKMNFSWEALEGANNALLSVYTKIEELQKTGLPKALSSEGQKLLEEFMADINNDLDMPKALALLHETLKSSLPSTEKYALLLEYDKIFGLGFGNIKTTIIPPEILAIAQERQHARQNKDWNKSDLLRQKIENMGWAIKDSSQGFELHKN
ncbi:MAG: cysteine--tRNA ligase [Candidatus Paceibacterota bacterium]